MWPIITTQTFRAWLVGLPQGVKDAITRVVEQVRERGSELKRPHADTLNGSRHANMKELRVKAGGQVIRIAFAFDPVRRAVLLVGGSKQGVKSKRFYAELVRQADALYDAHLATIPK